MSLPRYSQSRFARLFAGRNLIVIVLVVSAFYMLNSYRKNDPLPPSTVAPDFRLYTADNQTFNLHDISAPIILVFFNDYEFMSNNIYAMVYRRQMPLLKFLYEDGDAQVIIISKKIRTPEELSQLYTNKKYAYMQHISFVTEDNENTARKYGVRSWPHVYIIDRNHRIRASAKILSVDKISRSLAGFR